MNDVLYGQIIDSPIFGKTRFATEAESEEIDRLVSECPASVIESINKKMSEFGLMIFIESIQQGEEIPQ